MPINVNQLDTNALAQLAGQKAPYLNLPLADKSPLGSLFSGQAEGMLAGGDLQSKYAQIAAEMARAQLSSQTQYGVAGYNKQADAALKQYELQQQAQQAMLNRQKDLDVANTQAGAQDRRTGMLGAFDQQKVALQQGQLGINQQNADSNLLRSQQQGQNEQQKNMIDQAKLEIEARAKLTEDQRKQRGALGSVILSLANDPKYANDPDALNTAINNTVSSLGKGILSDKEMQGFLSSSPDQKLQHAQYDTALTGMANKLAQHLNTVKDAGGTALTQQNQTKQQELMANIKQQDNQFNLMDKKYDSNFFTTLGNVNDVVGHALERSPEALSKAYNFFGGDADAQKAFSANRESFAADTQRNIIASLQTGKGVRLNPKNLDMLKTMYPDIDKDGPQGAKAKYDTLKYLNAQASQTAMSLLQQGLKPASKEYQEKMNDTIQSVLGQTTPTQGSSSSTSSNSSSPKTINWVMKGGKLMRAE